MFQPNDEVEKGDVLFRIEKREFVAKRDLARADVQLAEVAQAKAKNDYERQEKVFEKGAIPEMQMVKAKAELDGSLAEIDASKARLEQAELDLEYTDVKAPISGKVGKALVKQGNLVSGQSSTHLATIVSYDDVYANFSISEREFLKFLDAHDKEDRRRSDVPILLARATDQEFIYQGSLNFTDLTVEQDTGTFAIRGIFPNRDGGLVPGLFVRIRVPIETEKDALLVPQRATAFDQVGSYLLTVNADNVVERKDVVLGAKFGEMVVVAPKPTAENTLEPQDRIIVDGVQRGRPGAVVKPVMTTLTIDESLLNPHAPSEPPSQPTQDVNEAKS